MSDNTRSTTETFAKKVDEILRLAAMAPSSHNTQPWCVTTGEDGTSLTVGYRPGRQLTIGDPDKRELFISLGCFIETLILAAQDCGFDTQYQFLGSKPEEVAKLQFARSSKRQGTGWKALINKRRSDRRIYEPTPLQSEDSAMLNALSYGHARLVLTEHREDIEFLAKMTNDATYQIMSRQAFRDELANWVRHNWTKRPDGMPGYTQGMPGPISLIAKFVIRRNKGVAKDQARKDGKRVAGSAAVGLICVDQESPEAWVEAGRLYQLICLLALRANIKTAAVSAAVILAATTQQIVETMHLHETPVALMRFGYKKGTVKSSPRLSAKDFLVTS